MNVIISLSTANLEVINFDILNKIYNLYKGNLHSLTLLGELYSAKGYKKYADELVLAFSPNLIITIPEEGQYLTFEDSTLELKLITNFSSDGFGVSYGDARTTILGTTFKDDTNITSFNEFKYFTKANTTPSSEMFRGCTNLESIDLSNMTSITTYQFRETAITDINAPSLTSYTGYNLFTQCTQLKTVSSLGHISVIPTGCFNRADNLETVNLPDECISIELDAFSPSLNSSGSLTEVNGIDHVLNFGYLAFYRLFNLHLYSLDLYNATSIGNRAFWYVKVHSINCPNLVSLGEIAFRENPVLTSIECLGKISSIPNQCFRQNTALQTAKIPYECTSIGSGTFLDCSSLTSITLYNKSLDDYAEGESPTFTNISRITSFGQSCFDGCSLLSLTPQDIQNATTIGDCAFRGVVLSGTLNLPNLTGRIGKNAFVNSNISSISSLGSVTEIGDGVFENTSISSITIPNSVKKCACNFVSNTVVPEIIFPEGVENISNGLFLTKNNSLTYIEIPSTVTNMGTFFHRSLEGNSNNICTIVIKATTPPELNYRVTAGGDVLSGSTRCEGFAGIYVPDASLTAYQNAANAWQHSSIQAKLKPISQLQTDNPIAWAKYNRV